MNDEEQLFGGFALLEPSAENSAMAVEKARAALLAPRASGQHIPRPQKRRWTRLAVAAAVLLVAGLVWFGLPQNDRLWAQVIRQLASAESVRVVSETVKPGAGWQVDRASTFARDFGFKEQHFLDGELIQTDIDDGTHHWSVRGQHKIVTQSESVEFTRSLQHLLNPLNSPIKFSRMTDQDQVIDGTKYFCYRSETENHRISIWVDSNERARRGIVESNASGKWTVERRINLAFEIEVDQDSFHPPRGDEYKIVNVGDLFEELFSLESAVHHEEKLGYQLAIHDVKRINDVEYYVLMSFRPTNETLAKLNLKRGESPGGLHPTARYERGERNRTMGWEASHRLAVADGNGVQVQALLCNLQGLNNERVDRAKLPFTLFAHSKLWSEVKSISDVTLEFALPDEETPIEEIVRSVYDTIALLEPVAIEQVHLVDEQDGREFVDRQFVVGGHSETTRQGPRPSEIRFVDFLEHVRTASFRRDLSKRAEAIQRRKREGSDDPLTFIEELDLETHERPLKWREKVRGFIDYPDLDVQLAALRLAEREPSLIYLHDTLTVIDKSTDERVQSAARDVVEALKRPLGEFKPRDNCPPIEFDAAIIGGLNERLAQQVDVQATVATLRKLTGLDYGDGETKDSRKGWSRWWTNEQASIARTHAGEREFIIYGRIVDTDGQPLKGGSATVDLTRSLGEYGTLQSAHTRADVHGNYVLRFGFLKQNPSGLPEGLPIVTARISGYPRPIQNDESIRRLLVSRFNLAEDPFLEKEQRPVAYSGQPFEMNFTHHLPKPTANTKSAP